MRLFSAVIEEKVTCEPILYCGYQRFLTRCLYVYKILILCVLTVWKGAGGWKCGSVAN